MASRVRQPTLPVSSEASFQTSPASAAGWTLRAIISGTIIGILINLANTYYGLRTGSGDQMAMISALLGFVATEILPGVKSPQVSKAENVLIISIATAAGCMPITAGFVGIVPALEYLIGPEENGPISLSLGTLLLWSVGLCFFGIIFASLLRKHFVVEENLPWPGPKAVGHLLNVLHRMPSKRATTVKRSSERDRRQSQGSATQVLPSPPLASNMNWRSSLARLVRGGAFSAFLTIVMYFLPILHTIPMFGDAAAREWLWTVDLSPGFFGQGMITGPVISIHMLVGAIVGWGILSPYAKSRGWAPGDTDDWTTGSRGWIIWISLASLLADASVKLTWFVIRPIWSQLTAQKYLPTTPEDLDRNESENSEQQMLLPPSETAISESRDDPEPLEVFDARGFDASRDTEWNMRLNDSRFRISSSGLGVSFLIATVVCLLAIQMMFAQYIVWYYTLLGIVLSLPMAVVGIRALAETDWNPESALVSQLTFAMIIPHSNPNGVIINLISAAIAQAGANQSGDIAYDFKIGHLLGAFPGVQVYGHVFGSVVGALVSCSIYKLYASQYPIPGSLFQIPSSYLVLSTARLVMGRGLPPGVAPFVAVTAVLSAVGTIIKMCYAHRWWQNLIPSGISFAIGIYLLPSFSIVRAFGGLFIWAWEQKHRNSHGRMIVAASGLVLGESLASLVTLAFTALRVPKIAG